MDSDILKIVWDGKIPIRFVISSNNEFSSQKISPYIVLVPRVSYIPLFTVKILEHFKKYVHISEDNKIWFSSRKSRPLQTHYPVGLIYDLLDISEQKLPLKIIVQFENYPSDILVDTTNLKYLESHFNYTIKEADYLKSRGSVIQALQKQDIENLWDGLIHDNHEQFWSVNRKLMDPEKSTSDNAHNQTTEAVQMAVAMDPSNPNISGINTNPAVVGLHSYKLIPIRIYVKSTIPPKQSFLQKPIKPLNEQLKHYLVSDLVHLFNLFTDPEILTGDVLEEEYQFMTHGIILPKMTTLQWLSENMSYPDNFLHLIYLSEPHNTNPAPVIQLHS